MSTTPQTKRHKSDDVMYGVFDVSMLSLRQIPAGEEFPTLADALEWIGRELDNGGDEDSRYEIIVCVYSPAKMGWYPAPGSRAIGVDARYFTPIDNFIKDDNNVN